MSTTYTNHYDVDSAACYIMVKEITRAAGFSPSEEPMKVFVANAFEENIVATYIGSVNDPSEKYKLLCMVRVPPKFEEETCNGRQQFYDRVREVYGMVIPE